MNATKRVRFVDIYEDLEKSLTKWLSSDRRAVNLCVEKIQWKAKEFARELEVDNFDDTEWCKRFFEKFCENNNTQAKRNFDNLVVGIRQSVTSCVEPIGRVPIHAVGCLSNVVISFGEEVVYNILLSCMASGTKLPPVVVTNVPFQAKWCNGIKLILKHEALMFDDCSAIEWLNNLWSLRHNFTYQSHSLLITNMSLTENVMKLFGAAATEVVIVPSAVENVLHPLENGIKEEFANLFKKEYQNYIEKSGPESIILSSNNVYQWISLAWQSISCKTVSTKFQKLGLFYEEATVNTCPVTGFESKKSYGDHMAVDCMHKIVLCNSENMKTETKDKSACSTSCKSLLIKVPKETNTTNQATSLDQQKDKPSSSINTSGNNVKKNMGDNDIEVIYVKGKEGSEKKNQQVREIKCFLCKSKFTSLIDLFVTHNCINKDNNSLHSYDRDARNMHKECYYCRTEFERDVDMLSHVCDYPF